MAYGNNFEVLLEKGGYALILRGNKMKEVAVVRGLNKESKDWASTCCYYAYEYDGASIQGASKEECIMAALDYFRMRTDPNYITRRRLEELCTKFKDGIIEALDEYANDWFNEECELEDNEKKWLGIKKPDCE